MRRLSVDEAQCKGNYTCPSVWVDDADPDHVIVVGRPAQPGPEVLMGEGEIAVRLPRQVIADATAIPLDFNDLERIAEFSKDRFRLETKPTYLVEDEADEFAAWKRGQRTLPSVDDDPWLTNIRESTATGVRWWRVRILDYPLTDYSAYELHGYQGNAAAGEDVYVADRTWSDELAGMDQDFWVFDDRIVVRMIYDDEGNFLHPEQASDVDRYLRIRSIAARHAVPLNDYLARIEPRLIA